MHPVHKAARDATGNREYIGKALVCNCGHLTRLLIYEILIKIGVALIRFRDALPCMW